MKKVLIVLMVAIILTGCRNDKENNISKQEWTYEMLESKFGGIIETDCATVQKCLNELAWKDYNVFGYITDKSSSNVLGYDILSIDISDDKDNPIDSNTLHIGAEGTIEKASNLNGLVYAKGENIPTFSEDYQLSFDSNKGGYISLEKKEEGYMSVRDFYSLMNKIYDDTYFKTDGILIQDGENYDDTPKYFIYPSEESYKEDKWSRVELVFLEPQSNLTGKHIVVIGNPDKNATFQGLKNCSIIKEKQ